MRYAITRHSAIGIFTGTTQIYTLLNHQNQHLVLSDSFGKDEELANIIDQSIFPLLYGFAAASITQGR